MHVDMSKLRVRGWNLLKAPLSWNLSIIHHIMRLLDKVAMVRQSRLDNNIMIFRQLYRYLY